MKKEMKNALDQFLDPYIREYKEEVIEEKILRRLESEKIANSLNTFLPLISEKIMNSLKSNEFTTSLDIPNELVHILKSNTGEDFVLPTGEKVKNPLYELTNDFYENFLYLEINIDSSNKLVVNWKFRDSKFSHLTPKEHRKFS